MSDFSVREMIEMQQALQEKYKDKWEPIWPKADKRRRTQSGIYRQI